MTKIKLLTAPQTYHVKREAPRIGLPLGILYIAAVLEKEGYPVDIFDSLLSAKSEPIGKGLIHLGTSWKEIEDMLRRDKPNIIGISNRWTEQIHNAIHLADVARKACPKALIVVGGPHASVRPLDFLQKTTAVDIVVMGEGEYVMLDILDYYEGKKKLKDIKSIAYRKGNKHIVNERAEPIRDLDSIAFPAYHLVDMEKYFEAVSKGGETRPDQLPPSTRVISMITSRGCPFNCIFCSIHAHMGRIWRAHSPEYVLNHLELVTKKYDVKHIHFEDDNLTLNKDRFIKILQGIISRKLNFSWDTPNGVRADTLNKEIISNMKIAGLAQLKIAVESGNQHVLDNIIEKRLSLRSVITVAETCKELDVPLGAFYVIGIVGETKKNIEETFDFALNLKRKYGVRPHINIAYPLISSRLYDVSKKKGYLLSEPSVGDFSNVFASGLIKTEEFSPEDLAGYTNKFYKNVLFLSIIEFLKNPKKLFALFLKVSKNPKTAFNLLSTGLKILEYK